MTHPHQLHAIAALWALRAARQHLAQAVTDEAKAIALEALEPADGLRAPLYGGGRGGGGHSDPVAGSALGSFTITRVNRYAPLADQVNTTLTWLAGELAGNLGSSHPDPAAFLTQIASGLKNATAANLASWATELDRKIRTWLQLRQDLWPLPGNPECPACHVRQLYAQTSAPITSEWTVICAAGCRCTGPGCTCGMPITEADVTHIWGAGSGLVEQHLARLEA